MSRFVAPRPPVITLIPFALAWFILATSASSSAAAGADLPATSVAIDRCSPNPFNPITVIAFTVHALTATGEDRSVRLTIFDLRGRRVARVLDEELAAGQHEATWNGRDQTGRPVRSGIYLARLTDGGGEAVARLTLLR